MYFQMLAAIYDDGDDDDDDDDDGDDDRDVDHDRHFGFDEMHFPP